MTQKQKQDTMFALVDAWRKSGKKREDFCNAQGIKASTFSYWITRRSKAGHPGEGFLPIDVSGIDGSAAHVELHYPNGIRVSVPADQLRLIDQLIRLY